MALKNRDDLSELGNRLYLLMDRYNLSVPDDKKIDTPKKLATALYEAGLVEVKNRENFNSDEINKNNAIGSIEKKIVRHINTGKISDKNGDYLPAYAKFFNAYAKFFKCSSDYILGLTDIISDNIEVRQICQATLYGVFYDYLVHFCFPSSVPFYAAGSKHSGFSSGLTASR